MHCGSIVGPLLTKDGQRNTRSNTLSAIDPDGLFCTLRCAARAGVAAARLAAIKAKRSRA